MLRLSKGEKRGTDRARAQILANTYEAVIGAIYLDQGYEASRQFIEKSLLVTFENILATGSWMDSKSHLQELVQSTVGQTPSYKVLSEVGPDHYNTFTIGAFVNGKLLGQGTGASKQIGQQQAADMALKKLKEKQTD
jgi:ribonuclease-3